MDPGQMIDLKRPPVIRVETSPDVSIQNWYRLRMRRFYIFYEEFTLSIPATGIVLMDGENGIGKSTIFKAISFVLYDHAGNSCYPWKDRNSKKKLESTLVELTFPDGLIIYRQRRPNLLRVEGPGISLIDDVAQGYIYKRFGTYNTWLVGGYLVQNKICAFFSMNSADKLQFLQEHSISERQGFTGPEQVEAYLEKVAHKYDSLQQQLAMVEMKAKMELEMYTRLHQQMPESFRQFSLWPPEESIGLNERLVKEKVLHQERLQRLRVQITEVTSAIAKHKGEEEQRTRLEQNQERIEAQLASLQSTENLPQLEKTLTQILEQISVAQRSERRTQLITIQADLQRRLSQLPDEKSAYTSSQLDSFEQIMRGPSNQELQEYLTKLEYANDYHSKFELYQRREEKRSRIEELEKLLIQYPESSSQLEIDQISNRIWTAQLQEKKLNCPKCQSNLYLHEGRLEVHESVSGQTLDELIRRKGGLQQRESLYRQREQVERELELARSASHEIQRVIQGKLDGFDPGKRPETVITPQQIPHLIAQVKHHLEQRASTPRVDMTDERRKLKQTQEREMLQKSLRETEGALSMLSSTDSEVTPQTDLQERRYQIEVQIRELRGIQTTRTGLDATLKQIQSQISLLQVTPVPKETPEELEKSYREISVAGEKTQSEIQAQIYFQEMVRVYNQYLILTKQYEELKVSLTSFHRIRHCLITAEYIILDNILSQINTSIAEVMENLFHEPMTVTLRSMKQLKSDDRIKPEINCEIVWRGVDCGNIKGMSGGEQSRISLAMIIAFSRFTNVPFVFLDEALAPMDIGSREATITTIRKYLGDKVVITVNHDTNKGIYDSVINMH